MGYMHIDNLYKAKHMLMFKELWALEKVHGTSAHVRWGILPDAPNGGVHFFSGGEKHDKFVALFDAEALRAKFQEIGKPNITVFGEAYGGKQQGMSDTYGHDLKFIVFDVKYGETWLTVPKAEKIATFLGLEFVPYQKVTTDEESLNALRDAPSIVAERRGRGTDKKREGVVLRPLMELHGTYGQRLIAKHKRDDFQETKTTRSLTEEGQKVLEDAEAIATEWVTEMRLTHVLDKFPDADITLTGKIIEAMIEDVIREAGSEIVDSQPARRAISKTTAQMFKTRISSVAFTSRQGVP